MKAGQVSSGARGEVAGFDVPIPVWDALLEELYLTAQQQQQQEHQFEY